MPSVHTHQVLRQTNPKYLVVAQEKQAATKQQFNICSVETNNASLEANYRNTSSFQATNQFNV